MERAVPADPHDPLGVQAFEQRGPTVVLIIIGIRITYIYIYIYILGTWVLITGGCSERGGAVGGGSII